MAETVSYIDSKILHKDEWKQHSTKVSRQVSEGPVAKRHHGKWKELINWVNGDQFSEWKEDKLVPVSLRRRKKKVVINLMKPLEEALQGKVDVRHQLVGSPNSADIEDVEASNAATKMLAHNDYTNDTETVLEDGLYDLINTGNMFLTSQFELTQHGFIPKITEKGVKHVEDEGEVVLRSPSVFNCRPDPVGNKRKHWRWFIEIVEAPREEVIAKFGVKEEELMADDDEQPESQGAKSAVDKYTGMNEPVEEKDEDEETEILRYYWERKSRKYPKGRLIIDTENTILYAKENPTLGEIPFWHVGFKKYGNSLWHTGPMHHVQPIQREFNRMISIISEHLEGWRAKMIVPEGSIVNQGSFTSDSFELLQVDVSRGEPKPATMPELSAQVTAYRDFLMHAVDKVSNVHEVSYSQLPKYASRAPASLFSMMLEQESLKIHPLIKRLNSTIKEIGRFRLRLMDKYYTEKRMVKVMGKGKTTTIEYFKGADLRGNFDVILEVGISMHQSAVVQQRMLLELKKEGILDERDKNKILKMLEMGEVAEELRGDIADESRAVRENQAFVNDTWDKNFDKGGVQIYLHDNHGLHMDYHTNLRKSEEAQRWPAKRLQGLDQHINQHFMAIQLLNQLAQQMAMGQGGVRPAPSVPQAGPTPEVGGGAKPGPQGGPAEGQQTPEVQQTRSATLM